MVVCKVTTVKSLRFKLSCKGCLEFEDPELHHVTSSLRVPKMPLAFWFAAFALSR